MRFDRKASKKLVFFKICCTFTYMYIYVPCSSIYKFSTRSFRELYKKESEKIKRRATEYNYAVQDLEYHSRLKHCYLV